MSVIAHLRIPADAFELGRVLDIQRGGTVELENMIPLGEKAVPFFSVQNGEAAEFEQRVADHPSVESIREVSTHDTKTLYALDWAVSRDLFFQGISETGAHLLSATGSTDSWEFELRFSDHAALGDFKVFCESAHIPFEVGRIYNPTRPDNAANYGLTPAQRDTLVRAVEGGYYSIPRRISTQELADEFNISDQAVTERLRRAIVTLVENSLLVAFEDQELDAVQ